jgi:hypothetical protein
MAVDNASKKETFMRMAEVGGGWAWGDRSSGRS